MYCCPPDLACDVTTAFSGDLRPWVVADKSGLRSLELIVPGISEPLHIHEIETKLRSVPGVEQARVNFTTRRVIASWRREAFDPASILTALSELGFIARPFDPLQSGMAADAAQERMLLKAVAVSGFAAANIMLLSVSVWSGADAATRDLFHWISAAIALPTVVYAGRPFFRSALRAVTSGQMNMDVPITLGVCLAALMSLYETFNHGAHAYFDASVTLLFFLLTGRYLDHLMRARARSAVSRLLSLTASSAAVIGSDGTASQMAVSDLKPGMTLLVAAGERFAADGTVTGGQSEVDRSLITGETLPEPIAPGASVHAGMLNLTAPVRLAITAAGNDTFLSEIVRLMTAAEQGRSSYVRIADRLARIYSPAVHVIAAVTLIGWLWWTGGDWHTSLIVATAVLIITCPCALGLAVPAVHVVASGVLFRNGAMIKDGAALEKLAAVDTVVFDKTGTLTLGRPRLIGPVAVSTETLALAAGLAQESRHPLSRAICTAARLRGISPAAVENVQEHPGRGMSGSHSGQELKLGSCQWCGVAGASQDNLLELVFVTGSRPPVTFTFEDELRPDAAEVVEGIKARGLEVRILSGDRASAVRHAAGALGIATWQAEMTPQAKLNSLNELARLGRKVLMVGDGLNDAPALAAGFTSMAPSSATDIGRTAADTVFFGNGLTPVAAALTVGNRAQQLSLQNFSLAVGYNVLAVPIAMLGMASPLIAAIAMSTSSLIVIANALRLGLLPVTAPAATRDTVVTALQAVPERQAA